MEQILIVADDSETDINDNEMCVLWMCKAGKFQEKY